MEPNSIEVAEYIKSLFEKIYPNLSFKISGSNVIYEHMDWFAKYYAKNEINLALGEELDTGAWVIYNHVLNKYIPLDLTDEHSICTIISCSILNAKPSKQWVK